MLSALELPTVANVATALAVIVALVTFVWEIRSARKQQDFTIFLRFVDAYERLQERRRATWVHLKETVRADPKIAQEIGDKASSLDYLKLRVEQQEPLYAIEHGVLENEIQSLNLLNELCRYGADDPQKMLLVKALFASEISYYQNRLSDVLYLREREKAVRLFSMPRADSLKTCQLGDFFQAVPRNA